MTVYMQRPCEHLVVLHLGSALQTDTLLHTTAFSHLGGEKRSDCEAQKSAPSFRRLLQFQPLGAQGDDLWEQNTFEPPQIHAQTILRQETWFSLFSRKYWEREEEEEE